MKTRLNKRFYIYAIENLISLTTDFDDINKFLTNIALSEAIIINVKKIEQKNTKHQLKKCYEFLNKNNTEHNQIFVVQLISGIEVKGSNEKK